MKTIISIIGILTLAQWVFVLMLHVFLTVQDKRSPETLNRLHDLPVVGGYFPSVEEPEPGDEDIDESRALRSRILDAEQLIELPKGLTADEVRDLYTKISEQRKRLNRIESELAGRREALDEMTRDLDRREQELLDKQSRLEARARELTKQNAELIGLQKSLGRRLDAVEAANLKKIAKIYDDIEPEKVVSFLTATGSADEDPKLREARAEKAARILALMSPKKASLVMGAMSPIDQLRLREKMERLPLKTKSK